MHIPGARFLGAIPLIGVAILGISDLGSVVLIQLTVPDDAAEAGRAAVQAIDLYPRPTATTAKIAYEAASRVAELHRQAVDPMSFTVHSNGGVTLTVRRTAPTTLFKHLPGLRSLADASATTTVDRVHY